MKSFSFFFYIIVILFSTKVFSQSISINTDGSQPHPSAILDVKSNTKGILFPRTSTTSRIAIVNPAKGLILYDTTTSGFWFHNGIAWAQLSGGSNGWSLTGNAGTDSATNFIGTTDYKPLVFRTNNIEQMHLSTLGKFGIGIKSPAAKLHVDGGEYVSLSSPGYLVLGNTAAANLALDYSMIQSRYNGAPFDLYLNYYGGYTKIGTYGNGIQVSPDGTVGIRGTNLSDYALTVNASSVLNGITVTDPENNYILYSRKSGEGEGIFVRKTSTSSTASTIYSSNSGLGAGVQGVGTNGDGVYGSSTGGDGVSGISTNGPGVYGSSTYKDGVSGYSSTKSGLYGYGYNGVYGEGVNYGIIGSSSSGVGVYGYSNSNYAGYFVGSVFSSGQYLGSDEKLKENIKDFSSAMNIINQLHPKQYDFRHDGNYKLMNLMQGNHYGLIAQDVEKILPGLVKNSRFDLDNTTLSKPADIRNSLGQNGTKKGGVIDFKALNYTELIPIMIKGMQEQQTIIEELRKQMTKMKSEMELLKKKN